MLKSLWRFSALERPAQTLFLRALVMLPLVGLSLKFRGFEATRSTMRKRLSLAIQQADSDFLNRQVSLTAHMVNAAHRHGLDHPSCVITSLTLWLLLGRGVITDERRGVGRE